MLIWFVNAPSTKICLWLHKVTVLLALWHQLLQRLKHLRRRNSVSLCGLCSLAFTAPFAPAPGTLGTKGTYKLPTQVSFCHFLPRTVCLWGLLFTLQVSPEASSSGEGYHPCSGGKESKVYSAAGQNPQTYQAALKRNDRKVVISTPGISTHSYLNNGTWKSLKPQRREKSPSETSCLLGSQSGQA